MSTPPPSLSTPLSAAIKYAVMKGTSAVFRVIRPAHESQERLPVTLGASSDAMTKREQEETWGLPLSLSLRAGAAKAASVAGTTSKEVSASLCPGGATVSERLWKLTTSLSPSLSACSGVVGREAADLVGRACLFLRAHFDRDSTDFDHPLPLWLSPSTDVSAIRALLLPRGRWASVAPDTRVLSSNTEALYRLSLLLSLRSTPLLRSPPLVAYTASLSLSGLIRRNGQVRVAAMSLLVSAWRADLSPARKPLLAFAESARPLSLSLLALSDAENEAAREYGSRETIVLGERERGGS
jgi:hypothetical protein